MRRWQPYNQGCSPTLEGGSLTIKDAARTLEDASLTLEGAAQHSKVAALQSTMPPYSPRWQPYNRRCSLTVEGAAHPIKRREIQGCSTARGAHRVSTVSLLAPPTTSIS